MTVASVHPVQSGRKPTTHGVASVLLALGVAALFFVLALSRWNTGQVTNYDLGIFAQSASSYAHGQWPYSEIRQLPLLGDHFSPILAINGLAWRIWPDPRVLLLTQSLAVAGAAWLVGDTASGRLGSRLIGTGATLVFIGGVGVLAVVLFDFHETAYAAPLLAITCRGLLDRSWRTVVVTSALLLLVKEDMGLTVMGVAACWLVRSRFQDKLRSALLVVLAIVGIVLATVVVARVNPSGSSEYLTMFGIGDAKHHTPAATGSLLDARRLMPFIVYTLATLVVGWRSPLTLVALPTLLWRAVSSNPLYWTPDYHYDLIPAVAGAFAAIDALQRMRAQRAVRRVQPGSLPGPTQKPVDRGLAPGLVAVLIGAAIAHMAWGITHAVSRLPDGIALDERHRITQLRELAERVPADAPVATLNDVGTYLVATHRHVHTLKYDHGEPVRYVMFSDTRSWETRYPRPLRDRLIAEARAAGRAVERRGPYTLVDQGSVRRVPGTRTP